MSARSCFAKTKNVQAACLEVSIKECSPDRHRTEVISSRKTGKGQENLEVIGI